MFVGVQETICLLECKEVKHCLLEFRKPFCLMEYIGWKKCQKPSYLLCDVELVDLELSQVELVDLELD